MANYTENFRLKKPEPEDFYDIEDFNGNMDILDNRLKEISNNKVLESAIENIKECLGGEADTDSTATKGSVCGKLNKLLTDWTSVRAEKIDSIYDTTLNSNNRLEEKVIEFELKKKIQDLALFGEKSEVFNDYNTLLKIASREEIYDNESVLKYILDGVIKSKNDKEIGKFLNDVCSIGSSVLSNLTSIKSICQNSTASTEILANEKARKLILHSDYALFEFMCSSASINALLNDSELFTMIERDEDFKEKVFNAPNLLSVMISKENFIRYLLSDFEVFNNLAYNYPSVLECFAKEKFAEIILESKYVSYLKTIFRNSYFTEKMLAFENQSLKILSNSSVISILKNDADMLANAFRSKYATIAYKNNSEILELVSKNTKCLVNLSELSSDIDATFYVNIQEYRQNMHWYISYKKAYGGTMYRTYNKDASRNGKGIFYSFSTQAETNGEIKLYGDSSKKKLIKTIPKGTAGGVNFLVFCFGSFYLEMGGNTSSCRCEITVTY